MCFIGIILTLSLKDYLRELNESDDFSKVLEFGRGIEREALRVLPEGGLSQSPHRYTIGSALTHPNITTDYSETLLEFITPVSNKPEEAIAQLQDIQKFTMSQIDGELLWPFSMPCFVNDEDKVQLAYFGESNIGKMKTVYRKGLKNRYGSMMQVISGIHFNFSFSDDFWRLIQKKSQDNNDLQTFKSDGYFALIRNYKRYCWLIPYLYGSSPVLCGSFLQGASINNGPSQLPFKKSDNGYIYLENATSLRMSDLGYTSSAQSELAICYNDLFGYLEGVEQAMDLTSDEFKKIGIKVDDEYQQLNANVLQIENELYAPIRPKRVAKSGEKPSDSLKNRGVEYIEVRALDVNPFVDTGISIDQVYFLDIFLTFCALAPSPVFDCQGQAQSEFNMGQVVVSGRDPKLLLNDNGIEKSVPQWGNELMDQFIEVAILLDKAKGTSRYSQSVEHERAKINNSELTPSAQLLDLVVHKNKSLTTLALDYAATYRESLLTQDYQIFDEEYFIKSVKNSHQEQVAIEQADVVSFDEFLGEYFN
jgi:glutamate--cysteine ligase